MDTRELQVGISIATLGSVVLLTSGFLIQGKILVNSVGTLMVAGSILMLSALFRIFYSWVFHSWEDRKDFAKEISEFLLFIGVLFFLISAMGIGFEMYF